MSFKGFLLFKSKTWWQSESTASSTCRSVFKFSVRNMTSSWFDEIFWFFMASKIKITPYLACCWIRPLLRCFNIVFYYDGRKTDFNLHAVGVRNFHFHLKLTDTGETVQSGREFFRLGADSYSSLARGGKKVENSVSTFARFHLWTSFESSPVSVRLKIETKK